MFYSERERRQKKKYYGKNRNIVIQISCIIESLKLEIAHWKRVCMKIADSYVMKQKCDNFTCLK